MSGVAPQSRVALMAEPRTIADAIVDATPPTRRQVDSPMAEPPDAPIYVPPKAVAARYGISLRAAERLAERGAPHVRVPGRGYCDRGSIRYPLDELDSWLRDQTRAATPKPAPAQPRRGRPRRVVAAGADAQ